MRICPACGREPAAGCDGFQVNAHRYGSEPFWSTPEFADWQPLPHCADCGTPVGAHHHANCLQARCMVCDDQAVCCEHAGDNGQVIGAAKTGGTS